jgi:diguanylate cyclase (GGDEF)-like protein
MVSYFAKLRGKINNLTLHIILTLFIAVVLFLKTKDLIMVLFYIIFMLFILLFKYKKMSSSKNIDPITSVYQLDYILKLGNSLINKGENVSVLNLDINEFKQINYTFGHFIGNSVLYQVGTLLKKEAKSLNGIVGRLGGDEFIILLRNASNRELNNFSRQLNKLFGNEYFKCDPDLPPIQISCSIGMASCINMTEIDIQDLLRLSDIDMYYNKETQTRSSAEENLLSLLPNDLQRLMTVLREKDVYSHIHSQYVMIYSIKLAKGLNLPDQMIENICIGAWIHDIGKLLIPNDILRKHGSLSDEEYNIIKKHVTDGLSLVINYGLSEISLNALKYHHERFDGKGYPYGLSGNDTPIEGKIMQIADAFSAMTIKRVYRDLISPNDALEELIKKKGTQFDPNLVDTFVTLYNKNAFDLNE